MTFFFKTIMHTDSMLIVALRVRQVSFHYETFHPAFLLLLLLLLFQFCITNGDKCIGRFDWHLIFVFIWFPRRLFETFENWRLKLSNVWRWIVAAASAAQRRQRRRRQRRTPQDETGAPAAQYARTPARDRHQTRRVHHPAEPLIPVTAGMYLFIVASSRCRAFLLNCNHFYYYY